MCSVPWPHDLEVVARNFVPWVTALDTKVTANFRPPLRPQEFTKCQQLSAPSPGDDLRLKSAIRLRGQNCTQRFLRVSL